MFKVGECGVPGMKEGEFKGRDYIKYKDSKYIFNGTQQHAAYLLPCLLNHASCEYVCR